MVLRRKLIDPVHSKLKTKLQQHPNLRKIFVNMGWLSFDRFFQLIVSFLVVLWVIRYLGPEQFGLLSYAGALAGILGSFAGLGIGNVLFRDLVNHPKESNKLLGTAFFLQLGATIIAVLFSIGVAYLLSPNDLFLVLLVGVCSVPLVLNSVAVIDYWFQSKVISKYTVISRNVSMTLTAVIKVLMIIFAFPLIYFALISILEGFLIVLFLVHFYNKNKQNILAWRFDLSFAKIILFESWPLLLSAIATSIYMRISQVMIGQMLSMTDVGIYSIAVKLSEFGNFIPGILVTSLLPSIILSKKTDGELFSSRFEKLYGLLIILSVGLALFLTIFSSQIVYFLYGPGYSFASVVLVIYAWSIVPMFISIALSQYLVIQKLTLYSFYTTLIGAVSNILLNLLLIPSYGLIGAAISTVIAYSIAVLSVFLFKETRKHGLSIISSFNIPKVLISLLK